jgi:DNA polymerase III subunit delta'
MTFDTFIGNSKIINRLRGKLREGRFPHALIFSGPEGVGKHTCAVMIAKALNCTSVRGPSDPEFCDHCVSCRKIEAGTHPDVMAISVEEDATQIKIAQIRRVLEMLQLQPLEGRNKVFIIDPAGQMNAEACNALLKALEEPPEKSFFILITINVHELLLTVRSRSQVYHFTPLTLQDIRSHGIADELAVRWSQGSIGRARSLDMEVLRPERTLLLDFLRSAIRASAEEFRDLFARSAELGRAKAEFDDRMAIVSVLIADLIYLKEGLPDAVVNLDVRDQLVELAAAVPAARLIKIAEFLRFIESSQKIHVNRQMLTDMLALISNESA